MAEIQTRVHLTTFTDTQKNIAKHAIDLMTLHETNTKNREHVMVNNTWVHGYLERKKNLKKQK